MFRNRLKSCREQKKVSQTKMAEYLNITRQAYNHYETGVRIPPQETLVKLAEHFNVTVDYLLGRTDDPKHTTSVDEELLRAQISTFGDPREYNEEELSEIKSFLRFVKQKRGEKK